MGMGGLTTWKALPGTGFAKEEKGREVGGEERGGAMGMKPTVGEEVSSLLSACLLDQEKALSWEPGEVSGERSGGGVEDTPLVIAWINWGGGPFTGEVTAFGFSNPLVELPAVVTMGTGPPILMPRTSSRSELLLESLPESSESLLLEELELLDEGLLAAAAEVRGGMGFLVPPFCSIGSWTAACWRAWTCSSCWVWDATGCWEEETWLFL